MSVSQIPVENSDQIWARIVGVFREVCILRKQGRVQEAGQILGRDLPVLIAAWSQSSPEESRTKRRELEKMFKLEEKKIEDAWLVQRLVASRLTDELVPSICSQISEHVRQAVAEHLQPLQPPALPARKLRTPLDTPPGNVTPTGKLRRPDSGRVRLDDIPGMIDAVLSGQGQEIAPRDAFA